MLRRIDKLPNFRLLLIEIRQMLLAQFLINVKFLLGMIFFTYSNIGLGQPVMHVRQIRVKFPRPQMDSAYFFWSE